MEGPFPDGTYCFPIQEEVPGVSCGYNDSLRTGKAFVDTDVVEAANFVAYAADGLDVAFLVDADGNCYILSEGNTRYGRE